MASVLYEMQSVSSRSWTRIAVSNSNSYNHYTTGTSNFFLAIDRYLGQMEVRPDRQNETQFLPSSGRVDTAIWIHYMDANLTDWEKAWRQLHKNAASNVEQVLEATPHKAVWPPTSHNENYSS